MKWISVTKDLPPSLDDVLVTDGEDSHTVAYYNQNVEKWFVTIDMLNCDGNGSVYLDGVVTHWMPLPSFPGSQATERQCPVCGALFMDVAGERKCYACRR